MLTKQLMIEVDCPSTSTSLPILHHLSREALQNLEEEDQIKKCFAINEGLINAIQYSDRTNASISFSIIKTEEYTDFIIKNYGAQISDIVLDNLSTQTFDDVLWEESGRGLLIINEIADEWSFSRDEQGRNILKIRMRDELYD
ncbi:anti-sigma regulatory factor (Ser/Thr protein kinase) [Schinkia azotoformans MEV2011]|uniref:Anti-sigma regulatory factor (Ser/Thr protein kinase) n=1 Tax=Schinkia azotoformans MEV2011 TaxID=1348973 RepID=A0A072NT07_SCHAZ|nr:ATP-binding protein [Schinkia azotoformans]KEF40008.1 anti-sigma regulatory factor (Ser/Thr protein kinase) [Schinkia azotoformans MEV2011]MEC1694704.1 ATP-binding protein [Schinkia azotoformans]MEC1726387.1 ATP-binding protein [Schinkia azotoformans]MEC1771039.1 ATP-binding protein [Schinkia azotoformans]MEC1780435.1 ATP-binding protein [Schinkia azotoformans]